MSLPYRGIMSVEAQSATPKFCLSQKPAAILTSTNAALHDSHLLCLAILRRVHASGALLVKLVAFVRGLLNRLLACVDLLDGGEDAGPVLENREWHVLAGAVRDEV